MEKKLNCKIVEKEFENENGDVKPYYVCVVELGEEEFEVKPKESQRVLFKYLLKKEVKQ